jgi:hypothetical protein
VGESLSANKPRLELAGVISVKQDFVSIFAAFAAKDRKVYETRKFPREGCSHKGGLRERGRAHGTVQGGARAPGYNRTMGGPPGGSRARAGVSKALRQS